MLVTSWAPRLAAHALSTWFGGLHKHGLGERERKGAGQPSTIRYWRRPHSRAELLNEHTLLEIGSRSSSELHVATFVSYQHGLARKGTKMLAHGPGTTIIALDEDASPCMRQLLQSRHTKRSRAS